MNVKGLYTVQHIRDNKIIGVYRFHNGITNDGLDLLMSVMFLTGSQSLNWYIGLVNASGFSAFSASDTMSSHAGWTEFTAYTEAARQSWPAAYYATGAIKNTSYATYNINGSGTIKGFFVVDSSTKSGTAGTLWSTAAFNNGDKTVTSGDIIKVQYQITASA